MHASQIQHLNVLWIGHGNLDPSCGCLTRQDQDIQSATPQTPCSAILDLATTPHTHRINLQWFEQPDLQTLIDLQQTFNAMIVCDIPYCTWEPLVGKLPILFLTTTDNCDQDVDLEQLPLTVLHTHATQSGCLSRQMDQWLKMADMHCHLHQTRQQLEAIALQRDDARLGLAMLGQQLVDLIEHDEQASHIQERILALVSHELRTPLNGIVGMAELLSDTTLDEQQSEEIRLIRESALKLAGMVDNLLDYRKLKFSESQIQESDFDLYHCIEQVIEHLQPQAVGLGLTMFDLIDPSTPQLVRGDMEKLRKILYCLASNAIKFTPEGQIVIKAKCLPVMGDVDYLQISVKDTGIGIPQEDIPSLFDAFKQLEEYHTRSHEGLGIGLYMARRLAQKLDGEITVESQPDVGSVFILRLPLKRVSSVVKTGPSIWQKIHKARVLVWTHNKQLAHVLEAQLNLAGCVPQIIYDTQTLETALLDRQSSASRGGDILFVDDQTRIMTDEKWFTRIMSHRIIPAICLQPYSLCLPEQEIDQSSNLYWDHQYICLLQQVRMMEWIADQFQTMTLHHTQNNTQHRTPIENGVHQS